MKITYKKELAPDKRYTPQEIVSTLLKLRDITDVEAFLNPPSPVELDIRTFDPTYDKSLKKVLKLLEKIYDSGKMVVVYTDYDADGVTGGAILWETLHLLGFEARPYVPHRVEEGYGFSIKGIDRVKREFDPALIISVDHGITAREKITHAKSIGIPIVVTDHHMKQEHIPDDALAIYHIPLLSGSGVSYFFSKAIYEHFKDRPRARRAELEENFRTDYLALATIGTVADLVPLVGPSRAVVTHGLRAFSRLKRVGITELLASAGASDKPITPYEIGFIIAPRINAIGRLEHAIDALRLLCTTDRNRAQALASSIGEQNTKRQDLVRVAIEEAIAMVEREYGNTIPPILILRSHTWHEGIIGLIAAKLVEKYYRPTIVMTRSEGTIWKGSARSIASFHVTEFLRSHKSHLIDAGGHKAAAGMSIQEANIPAFVEAATASAATIIQPEDLVRTIEADLKIPLNSLNIDIAGAIESMAPFGVGNPQPTFASDIHITDVRTMGKSGDHLKLTTTERIEFVAFSSGHLLEELTSNPDREAVYRLEINRWNGTQRLQAKVVYI